jgi:putative FmdB family regulatory protein
MPMYDFECSSCGNGFEEIVPSDAPPPPCPACGAATERLLSAPMVGKGGKRMSKGAQKYLSPEVQSKLKAKAEREGKRWGPPK